MSGKLLISPSSSPSSNSSSVPASSTPADSSLAHSVSSTKTFPSTTSSKEKNPSAIAVSSSKKSAVQTLSASTTSSLKSLSNKPLPSQDFRSSKSSGGCGGSSSSNNSSNTYDSTDSKSLSLIDCENIKSKRKREAWTHVHNDNVKRSIKVSEKKAKHVIRGNQQCVVKIGQRIDNLLPVTEYINLRENKCINLVNLAETISPFTRKLGNIGANTGISSNRNLSPTSSSQANRSNLHNELKRNDSKTSCSNSAWIESCINPHSNYKHNINWDHRNSSSLNKIKHNSRYKIIGPKSKTGQTTTEENKSLRLKNDGGKPKLYNSAVTRENQRESSPNNALSNRKIVVEKYSVTSVDKQRRCQSTKQIDQKISYDEEVNREETQHQRVKNIVEKKALVSKNTGSFPFKSNYADNNRQIYDVTNSNNNATFNTHELPRTSSKNTGGNLGRGTDNSPRFASSVDINEASIGTTCSSKQVPNLSSPSLSTAVSSSSSTSLSSLTDGKYSPKTDNSNNKKNSFLASATITQTTPSSSLSSLTTATASSSFPSSHLTSPALAAAAAIATPIIVTNNSIIPKTSASINTNISASPKTSLSPSSQLSKSALTSSSSSSFSPSSHSSARATITGIDSSSKIMVDCDQPSIVATYSLRNFGDPPEGDNLKEGTTGSEGWSLQPISPPVHAHDNDSSLTSPSLQKSFFTRQYEDKVLHLTDDGDTDRDIEYLNATVVDVVEKRGMHRLIISDIKQYKLGFSALISKPISFTKTSHKYYNCI